MFRRVAPLGFMLIGTAMGFADDAEAIRKLNPTVATKDERDSLARMIGDDARRRRQEGTDRENAAWRTITSKAEWEAYRDPRVERLRESLGSFAKSGPPKVKVTATIPGDGFVVENVAFEGRPGFWVTANLYRPAEAKASMPGILICHAHHTPKEHGELQDMGMTWARAGCVVLVMDQLGHGERRQHPFADATAYPKPFRLGRQDYFFRYDTGIQLHLAGESLAGWMANDLMRGVDLLLARKGVDPKRIILLGAVAGGGDPAAVTAALDRRITAAVPFNFGGPQPETRYPLPDDAEATFNYAGGGSWESTRNLRRSVGDGFLPWVIVGSVAPRHLIYAHEFRWDRDRDPVWKRLEKIHGFYDAGDRLAFTHGFGGLSGQPPEASHCTHIGPPHRVRIHGAFKTWFGIDVTPQTEFTGRVPTQTLRALTPEAREELKPQSLSATLGKMVDERLEEARQKRSKQTPAQARDELKQEWAKVLGGVESPPARVERESKPETIGGSAVQRFLLMTQPGIRVPAVLLAPKLGDKKPSVVVGVGYGGKAAFLKERSAEIDGMLKAGLAVCLVDVRGTGETAAGESRGRNSSATSLSSSVLMLGDTVVGGQLRDLRSVLAWLRTQSDVDGSRVGLWGESFAAINPEGTTFNVPRDDDSAMPKQSEPLGGLLALLAGLYEDSVKAVRVRGGLSGFRDVLDGHLVSVPHDAVVPGVLRFGDLADLAAAIAPKPLCMAELVDGRNQRASAEKAKATYSVTFAAYKRANDPQAFTIPSQKTDAGTWFAEKLR